MGSVKGTVLSLCHVLHLPPALARLLTHSHRALLLIEFICQCSLLFLEYFFITLYLSLRIALQCHLQEVLGAPQPV